MSAENTNPETTANTYSSFWPLCLLTLSLGMLLVWQVTLAGKQYVNLQKIEDQQKITQQQATQAEAKLQAIMMDVLELSKTNPAAQEIIKKYGIKVNPPPQPVLPEPVM